MKEKRKEESPQGMPARKEAHLSPPCDSRTAETLERSEKKWRSLVDSAHDAILSADHSGKIISWNRRAVELFGYTVEEVVGKPVSFIMPERFHTLHLEGMEKTNKGLAPGALHKTIECAGLRKDGREFPIELSIAHFRSGGECFFTGIIRDTTERKRILEELRRSEEKYRSLVESLHEGVWAIDKESRTVFVNRRMAKMLGYSREEMLGASLFDFMDERGVEICQRNLERRRTGISEQHEFELLRKDGSRIYTLMETSPVQDSDGSYAGALAGVLDITERRETEEALRASEKRFRVLFETSRDLICFLETDQSVLWANPAWYSTLGYTTEGIGNPFEKVHPDDLAKANAAWEDVVKLDREITDLHIRYLTVAGSYLHLKTSARKLTAAGKTLVYVVSSDISEVVRLRERKSMEKEIPGIIGQDSKMKAVFEAIRELAPVSAPVLIQGESGTGKELVAEAIHRLGPRAAKAFIPVNCGALPDSLLESELFGHVKGAFTGALRDRKGRFELADGGTIFLDEIAEISPAMQVRLLRVLQEGTFEPVGGEKTVHVDVRVISATNKELEQEIANGSFREDLFFRLSVVPLLLPPLRERPVDIPLLAEHIIGRECERSGREKPSLSPGALAHLMGYSWRGNVRELQNALSFALIKCQGGIVEAEHLPPTLLSRSELLSAVRGRRNKLSESTVHQALDKSGGNKVKAARLLGVSRATLYRFLDRHSSDR